MYKITFICVLYSKTEYATNQLFDNFTTLSHSSNTSLDVRLRSAPRLLDFHLLQHVEGFAKDILAMDFLRIQDLAQFVAGEHVETSVVGIRVVCYISFYTNTKNIRLGNL